MDLTYKMKIGSTVTKNSMLPLVANDGMEKACKEEKTAGSPSSSLSLANEK